MKHKKVNKKLNDRLLPINEGTHTKEVYRKPPKA